MALNPFQGLKPMRLPCGAELPGLNGPKSLSGIETGYTIWQNQSLPVSMALNPFQGLKRKLFIFLR